MGKVNTNINPYNALNVQATHIGGIQYPEGHPNHQKSNDIYLNTDNENGKVYIKVDGENKSMQDFFTSASETKTMLSDALAEFGVVTSGNESGKVLANKLNHLLDSTMKSGTVIPLYCTGPYCQKIMKDTVQLTPSTVGTGGRNSRNDYGANSEYSSYSNSYIMMPANDDTIYYTSIMNKSPYSNMAIACGKRHATAFNDDKIKEMIIELDVVKESTISYSIYNEAMDVVIFMYRRLTSSASEDDRKLKFLYLNPINNLKEKVTFSLTDVPTDTNFALHAYDRKSTKLIMYRYVGNSHDFTVSVYDLESKSFDFKNWNIGSDIRNRPNIQSDDKVIYIGYDKRTNTYQAITLKGEMVIYNTNRQYMRRKTTPTGASHVAFKNLGDGTYLIANDRSVYRDYILIHRRDFPKFINTEPLQRTSIGGKPRINSSTPKAYNTNMSHLVIDTSSNTMNEVIGGKSTSIGKYATNNYSSYYAWGISYVPGYPPILTSHVGNNNGSNPSDNIKVNLLDMVLPDYMYSIIFIDYDKDKDGYMNLLYAPRDGDVHIMDNLLYGSVGIPGYVQSFVSTSKKYNSYGNWYYELAYFNGPSEMHSKHVNRFRIPAVCSVKNSLWIYYQNKINMAYNAIIVGERPSDYTYTPENIYNPPPPPVLIPYQPGGSD